MCKPKEVKRKIKSEVERVLYARSAGRCAFDDCNKSLLRSSVTQERVNIGEMAHVWSFSKGGPRGQGPFQQDPSGINDPENLLLICRECHKLIDADREGKLYFSELLLEFKRKHEERVEFLTSIRISKRSHAVTFIAPIGENLPLISQSEIFDAMLPEWYPVHERAVNLSMIVADEDDVPGFWVTGERHLQRVFERKIRPLIEENIPCHFSIFAIAPQPLLILLGSLFTDLAPTEVYQRRREPPTWKWLKKCEETVFILNRPIKFDYAPALLLSLSGRISHDRVHQILGKKVAIWEITIEEPHNDFLKSRNQLILFRETVRKAISEISAAHGNNNPLAIFPAMGVAFSVELGRVRMPKSDMPWDIFDENRKKGGFTKTLTIRTTNKYE